MKIEWGSEARPTLEWFGQTCGTLAPIERQGVSAVASVIGRTGPGVPHGGGDGQILAKATTTDFDTEWIDAPSIDGIVDDYDPGDLAALFQSY